MRRKSIFVRFPVTTIVIVNIVVILALGGALELGLRYYTSYNIGYYTAIKSVTYNYVSLWRNPGKFARLFR